MPFHRAQKTLNFRGPTPSHLPSLRICTHLKHYAWGCINYRCSYSPTIPTGVTATFCKTANLHVYSISVNLSQEVFWLPVHLFQGIHAVNCTVYNCPVKVSCFSIHLLKGCQLFTCTSAQGMSAVYLYICLRIVCCLPVHLPQECQLFTCLAAPAKSAVFLHTVFTPGKSAVYLYSCPRKRQLFTCITAPGKSPVTWCIQNQIEKSE